MNSGLCFLLCLVASLCLTFIVAQEETPPPSFWEADLTAACGGTTDTSCVDQHMNEIFSNLTRLYNPEGGIFSNLSYLDHHLYGPSSAAKFNDTLATMLKLYPGNYSDAEMSILQAFPHN